MIVIKSEGVRSSFTQFAARAGKQVASSVEMSAETLKAEIIEAAFSHLRERNLAAVRKLMRR